MAARDSARQRKQHRGWCWYDWANQAFQTSVLTVFLSLYLTTVAIDAARQDFIRNGPNACSTSTALEGCDISLLGLTFPAGSLWGYLMSAATVVQIVVLPIVGAIADRSRNKPLMLAFFAFVGAGTTSALALVGGTNWLLGALLFVVANGCYGASIVVYYSFIPEIAEPDQRDKLSSRGWAFGYLGGGAALALHLVLYLMHGSLGLSEQTAVRLVFFSAGLWWAVFTLLPLAALRGVHTANSASAPEASPDAETGPEASAGASVREETRRRGAVLEGFQQLKRTLAEARHFPLTLGFLGAYMVFADGITTVPAVASQYGRFELGFPQQVLIVTILLVQFVAFIGGVLHGLLAKRIGAKKTILISLGIWILVLVAAYFVQHGQQLQFYALAAGIGLVLGGTMALARSLFSQMIPAGREAQYFSLYEIGERSTSWMGPLVFAAVGQATGSFRLAIVSLVVFFAVGLLLVWLVPARRAIQAAGNEPPGLV